MQKSYMQYILITMRYYVTLLMLACTVACADVNKVEEGYTYAEVQKAIGAPLGKMTLKGKMCWQYSDGFVEFKNGKAIYIESFARKPSNPKKSAAKSKPTEKKNSAPTTSPTNNKPVIAQKEPAVDRYLNSDREIPDLINSCLAAGSWNDLSMSINTTFKKHLERLQTKHDINNARRILADSFDVKMLAELALIERTTLNGLNTISSDKNTHDFLRWFLDNTVAIELFLETIQQRENAPLVLKTWASIFNQCEGNMNLYRLAIACSVVFDSPRPFRSNKNFITVSATDRFAYYETRSESMKCSLTQSHPCELVWVVDAMVPDSELDWARAHINLRKVNWFKTYDMVEYEMKKITERRPIYKSYCLSEINRQGGTCSDQTYFGTITAKAWGIPAIPFSATGQRGRHAWFGYKSSDKEWNMDAGRYKDDLYLSGSTTDPQTQLKVSDHMIKLKLNSSLNTPQYRQASRILWLSKILATYGENDRLKTLLRSAVQVCPMHIDSWTAYIRALKLPSAGNGDRKFAIELIRKTFKKFPDMLVKADQLERMNGTVRTLSPRDRLSELNKKFGSRTDLKINALVEDINMLSVNDPKAAEKLMNETLRAYGRNASILEQLAPRYYELCQRNGHSRRGTDNINTIFKQNFAKPQASDYFKAIRYVKQLRMVAAFYDKDGRNSEAHRLRAIANQLEDKAKNLAKHK